ncbi:uncharacterized protein EDB91DRAFT_1148701 [Suillus paluster]|uniref:uncharacterized protein n=1 Tax=Suillus paluster TaxID=48578 RepID=UPI001B871D5E|nr:uncharacterized protein EDB91DRAFT_1148701 [Suillus paluster]KAG1733656.1 hypothetical protein EDB91DRAFT_1148701 [Suillus paluster]
MAFEIQQLLTSGRIQKCGFTPLYSPYESSVSDAEVMSPFSVIAQDISPDTSHFSVDSNNSSTQKSKRRRNRRGHFSRRRRSSKRKAAVNSQDVSAFADSLNLEGLASLSSNWLNLSFPDRTPGYADYFVNYWRHAVAVQKDLFMDNFTRIMAVVHEDLWAGSAVRSTQPTVQGNEAPSRCIQYEDDLFAVTCPWDNDDWNRLDDWRRGDDEVHIPTDDQRNYGAIGQPLVYPQRNMGTNFEIVAPKPFRAWYEPRSWLAHPPVAPEPVTSPKAGSLKVSVEPESPGVVHDIPLYHLPDFHIDVIFAGPRALQIERNASHSSTTTGYAESVTLCDSEDMTKYTSSSQHSASPSSYLSAVAASIMPPPGGYASPSSYLSAVAASIMPPPGGYASPPRDNYPDHTICKTEKAVRLERQYSRQQKMSRFSCMSYDQKVAEIERSIRWMRAHSRRV